MTTGAPSSGSVHAPVCALVVHPDLKVVGAPRPQSALAEAVSLAQAIDLVVPVRLSLPVRLVQPGYFFGSGQIAALQEACHAHAIAVVVVNTALSPVQQRNLEQALACKVVDRTGLILEIFGARAQTREGILQVELAHLTYQQSRLVRSWTHLERQRGGYGFLGGPGETQIETDRRLLRGRIARLQEELASVRRTRALHRHNRRRHAVPVITLVGYTNAGKSTLFNQLTQAEVLAKDMLFATLDPTMRRMTMAKDSTAILSDTVGFIADLPTQLVAAFRATLEEVVEADMILNVRDIAHPESDAQNEDVNAVLETLGIGADAAAPHQPIIVEVWNKIDRFDAEGRAALLERAARMPHVVPLSAAQGWGLEDLRRHMNEALSASRDVVTLVLPHAAGEQLAWLYRHGDVLERTVADDGVHICVRLSAHDAARFRL